MQDQHNPRIFYVYAHRRATDGSVFYIGKGKGFRATNRSSRNIHWRRIVAKHDYTIEFIKKEMDEKSSFELEEFLISELRLSGFVLANITNGGEGESGRIISEEAKVKMKAAKLGKAQSPEHAAKSARSRIGHTNSEHSKNVTSLVKSKKIINSDGEHFKSVRFAAETMSIRLGLVASEAAIAACARGQTASAYGLAWSYDTSATPIYSPFRPGRLVGALGVDRIFSSVTEAVSWVEGWRGSANNQCISGSARSLTAMAYGYKWYYLDNNYEDVA